jgi:hypothetical protein
MQVEAYVQAIRQDLAHIVAVGDNKKTARVGELLAGALAPSLERRLQEALTEAALELSAQLPDGRVEVRVSGSDPELVYVADEPSKDEAEQADAVLGARITLRLSEALKSRIEEAAGGGGVSVNTWIVRSLERAVQSRGPRGGGPRHRLTGYGRT